ncbi:MAG: PTS transporter subunit EIIC [Sporolactobacillus sp.]|jgi:PTS system cellobiose-specific IIC component|nr:PTS transporter subunit EIIC [Sporolactobacillus sp.]
MDLLMHFLEKYLMPLSDKVTSNKLLTAIKDACILTASFTVVGSLAGLVAQQATYWFKKWGILNDIWQSIINVFSNINTVSMGLIGLVVVIAASYTYAKQLSRENEGDKCVPLVACIVSVIAYIATVPNALKTTEGPLTAFPIKYFSYEGMFTGMLVGLLSAWMYHRFVNSKFTIKLPGQVLPMVLQTFLSIIPFFTIITVFSVLKEAVELAGFDSFLQLMTKFIITPLNGIGTGLPAVIIVILIMQLLWFFGVHGFSIMWGLISVLWMPIFYKHIQLYVQTGSFDAIKQVAPNTLCNVYAMVGGSGSTLALVVLLLFLGKKGSPERAIGKVAIIPGLFGINEPVTFGLPIVLNPIMFIPFLLVPIINAVIGYFATATRLVNPLVVLNSGVEPVFVNVWVLGAFTISPVILYGILFILDLVMYYPFVRLQLASNKREVKKEVQTNE